MQRAELGIVGGSGFYEFLDDVVDVEVETPWGEPSGAIAIGSVAGRSVAFLPRHGRQHEIPPHRINARANLWALRELGVDRVIGPCASGSINPGIGPGDLVILDQLVDRTWGRADTFLESSIVEHVSFADPYCPELRKAIAGAANGAGWEDGAVHERGTVVVVQGPRFSTRAESRWYGGSGIDVINMTQYPEAYLAREMGMCYAGVALVTDRDVGVEGDPSMEPVTMKAAMAVLAENVERTRALLAGAIPAIPRVPACRCRDGGAPSLRRLRAV